MIYRCAFLSVSFYRTQADKSLQSGDLVANGLNFFKGQFCLQINFICHLFCLLSLAKMSSSFRVKCTEEGLLIFENVFLDYYYYYIT